MVRFVDLVADPADPKQLCLFVRTLAPVPVGS